MGVCAVCLIACGKSENDADEPANALYGNGEIQTDNNENIGTETETTADERAGLYQSGGSFIHWNDLNINVVTDYFDYNYKTSEKSPYVVFSVNDYDGELVLPNDLNLTKIGVFAFMGCRSLTSIDLSKTQITIIGDRAFNGCRSLTSIDFPDTLTEIGRRAFKECTSLDNIDLSNTQITGIGGFSDCTSLTNINYAGTMDEWYAIFKYPNWWGDAPLETITCSDGVITL